MTLPHHTATPSLAAGSIAPPSSPPSILQAPAPAPAPAPRHAAVRAEVVSSHHQSSNQSASSQVKPLSLNAKQQHRIVKRRLARQTFANKIAAAAAARQTKLTLRPLLANSPCLRRPRDVNGRFFRVGEARGEPPEKESEKKRGGDLLKGKGVEVVVAPVGEVTSWRAKL